MTPEIDPRAFRSVLGRFCTGITIITTVDEGSPVGFACQSFSALSLDPPLIMFCPGKMSRSWAAIERAGSFCVNILGENQQSTCARFGSPEPDKFAGVDWTPTELGSPALNGSLAHIDCTVERTADGGDHTIVIGRVHSLTDATHSPNNVIAGRPLLFYRGQYTAVEPGRHTPAGWRGDLQDFLTTAAVDTWL
ncbi:MAG: 3-hydroxy-9,10-secoandrosta-1,3,5(10)-triene-9,17-dione monooxygenase reductase subunit [Rhodococcus sp. (in: high G+C Gram-positive bacteria)]